MTTTSNATSPFPSELHRRWVVIGDPGDRRLTILRQEVARVGVQCDLIDYRSVLRTPEAALRHVVEGAQVRLESPGRAPDLQAALFQAGEEAAREEGLTPLSRADVEIALTQRGRLLNSRQWFLGFSRLLRDIDECLGPRSVVFQNAPREILVTFDKAATRARFAAAQLPIPRGLPEPSTFEGLRAAMDSQGIRRVFVKLAHGSSASGLVAFRFSPWGEEAFTTVEVERRGTELSLFNTRRIRRLTNLHAIEEVIQALLPHRVVVEDWVPKGGLGGKTFDLRLLLLEGEPRHALLRLSAGPFTNLHLGSERCSLERIRSDIRESDYSRLLHSGARAAACFPESRVLALDIALAPNLRNHHILEANAFGDLLLGVTHRGQTPYEAEGLCLFAPKKVPPQDADRSGA